MFVFYKWISVSVCSDTEKSIWSVSSSAFSAGHRHRKVLSIKVMFVTKLATGNNYTYE